MNISNVVVSDDGLKMEVTNSKQFSILFSPLYKICVTECQLQEISTTNNPDQWNLLIKFKKCFEDELLYTFIVKSTELKLSKTFISDDSDWRELGWYENSTNNFNIEINIRTISSPYSRFVDDDSLTDFEMKGIDGSIRVHKIVLAAASEVFEKMITNDFKETNEARVELPYSKDVLKDFKDYLYLNTINNDNLEHLLLLSHCYMINKLKQYCFNRLIFNMTAQNTLELIEFAVENKVTELLIAIVNKLKTKK